MMARHNHVPRWSERNFIQDLIAVGGQGQVALKLYFARVAELRRNSGLGLSAPILSVLVHVGLLGSVMSVVFQNAIENFLPYFSISFCLWQAISISLSDSANANERVAHFLSFPQLSGYLVHLVNTLEMFTALLLKLVASLLVIAIVNPAMLLNIHVAGLLTGVFLIVGVMFAWALPIAYVFDRFRMLRGFLPQILLAVYLVSPILWEPTRVQKHSWIVTFNPIFHLIEVARVPVLLGTLPPASVGIATLLLFTGLIFSAMAFRRNRDQLVYQWIA